MRIFAALLTVASLRCTQGASLPPEALSVRNGLPPNHTLSTISWTLPIVEGGEEYTFNGTIEEVFAQVNDERAKQGLGPLDDPLSNSTHIEEMGVGNLIQDRSLTRTECKVGLLGAAASEKIQSGIKYLGKLKTKCRNGAGPGNCGRISCSWNSAIYWCNDKSVDSENYDCSSFAPYAQAIFDECSYRVGLDLDLVWGQAWDTDNFRVIIGLDHC
ncbi:hypothetical protein GGR57DRAFT_501085 [Xylariaceae sp. FL1272]|nr:hypothetical protein GGR57DRAFT_501085 [Xylariaceae sp. FL1272]